MKELVNLSVNTVFIALLFMGACYAAGLLFTAGAMDAMKDRGAAVIIGKGDKQ